MTNAEHIRSMTDREMAEWLEKIDFCCQCCPKHDKYCEADNKAFCIRNISNWLKRKYRGGKHDE